MMTLPAIDRRAWLALWAQGRRRARQHHLLPAPVLAPQYPSLLVWQWALPDPVRWNVWMSVDGGGSWALLQDYWTAGAARQFAPDGGSEWYFIVGVDEFGREITEHSNQARPDDAVFSGPTIINLYFSASGTRTGAAVMGQEGDYWNRIANETYARALLNQQGSATPATITVSGYYGRWSTGFADPMMNDWIYEYIGTSFVVESLPAGCWDIYCYSPLAQAYSVRADGVNKLGPKVIPVSEYPNELPFAEGVNYVFFDSVYVAPGDGLEIFSTGRNSEPNSLFGFQIVEAT